MLNYIYEITSGLLASFVAIYGLNYFYGAIPHLRQELGSYRDKIIYIPLIYIGITLLVSKILDSIVDDDAKIRNYFPYIKGLFIGIILSFLGMQYWKIDKILNIDNPLMTHLYMSILYIIIYGVVIQYMLQNSCH